MTKTCRQSNFELLRIIAMLMIVAHHLVAHGVQHVLFESVAYKDYLNGSLLNKIVASFLLPGGTVGVAIFFMLTGYFLINKEKGAFKNVCVETVFYCLLTGVIFALFLAVYAVFGIGYPFAEYKAARKIAYLIIVFCNPVFGVYWFVATYVLLVFMVPVLNVFLKKLSKKGYVFVLIVSYIVVYVFQTCLQSGFANIGRGIFFYMLGGFLSEHRPVVKHKVAVLLLFALFWTVYALGLFLLAEIKINTIQVMGGGILNCLFTPLCACSLCIFFSEIGIKNHSINAVAKTTFGIYLIHESMLSVFIWNGIFKVSEVQFTSSFFPLFAFFDIFVLFVACSIIDYLRIAFVEKRLLFNIDRIISILKDKFYC